MTEEPINLASYPANQIRFTAPFAPVGKPRMTRQDKWKERPAVLRYRYWSDKMRTLAPKLPEKPAHVSWRAFFPMPESWSKKKKEAMRGQVHQVKPDRDNIDKALLDTFWKSDSCVAIGHIEKRWDDGKGQRFEIIVSEQP